MAFLLRTPTPDDLPALIAIHCDPRTNAFRPGGPPAPAEAAACLPLWLAHWNAYGFGYWSIVEADAQRVVGFGGVMQTQIGARYGFNLYFRLTPDVWGRGAAAFVGQAGLAEAFERQQAHEVLGIVRPANVPSRRALERLGMQLVDVEDDVPGETPSLIYAMRREDWRGRNT